MQKTICGAFPDPALLVSALFSDLIVAVVCYNKWHSCM